MQHIIIIRLLQSLIQNLPPTMSLVWAEAPMKSMPSLNFFMLNIPHDVENLAEAQRIQKHDGVIEMKKDEYGP